MKLLQSIILLLSAACAALPSAAAVYAPADVPNVHLSDSTKFVSNPDGLLDKASEDEINRRLADVWRRTTAEPVVVAIGSIPDGYDVNHYANDLFELWGIGKKDTENGLLILIVGDQRKYVVRTGTGLGGVLPDALCGRVMRHEAVPHFKNGEYGRGTLAAVNTFADAMTSPEAADELRSKYANNASPDSETDFFTFYLYCCAGGGIFALIWILYLLATGRGRDEQQRYQRLSDARPVVLFLCFLCLGAALPAFLICRLAMNRLRNHPRNCPNCSHAMRKLDEQTDNNFLTPAQDTEEQLNSVDYDVWLCDNCGEKDVIPYINKRSHFTECPNCGARACSLVGNRIIKQPTTSATGLGERIYTCRNCGKQSSRPYTIAKLAAAAPVVLFPGGGGGGGFGGGFGGGSFGGGGTMGGGASGGW